MEILVAGGGPAGLSAAYLLKSLGHEVRLLERRSEDDVDGWGITLGADVIEFDGDDPYWKATRGLTVRAGEVLREDTREMSSIARAELLRRMRRACRDAGVALSYQEDAAQISEAELDACGLVLIADGANSRLRDQHVDQFGVTKRRHETCFIWLGTDVAFDGMTLLLSTDDSLAAIAWAYPYARGRSTFVVEMREQQWRAHGFADMPPADSVARLEAAFAPDLRSGRLRLHQATRWQSFWWVQTQSLAWTNRVLLGDAACTKHYCVGAGTFAAVMDGAALAEAFEQAQDVNDALQRYQRRRHGELLELARRSEQRADVVVELLRSLESGTSAAVRALITRENL